MGKLSLSAIELVKTKVVKDFPEMKDVEPICRRRTVRSEIAEKLSVSLPKRLEEVYVLTFRKEMVAEGFHLDRVVRATVTGDGRVIKVTVSK